MTTHRTRRAEIRAALNTIVVSLILLALAFAAVLVAIEAVWLLTDGDGHVGPIDYEGLWDSVSGWDPARWVIIASYCGAILVGLLILFLEFFPRGRDHDVEIARSESGVVFLDERTVAPVLADRVRDREWVERADPRVRLEGTTARVSSRPAASRPWDEAEVTDIETEVRSEIERLGLEPGEIGIKPRSSGSRRARNVR